MKPRTFFLLSLATLLLGTGQGCADTDNTIFIRQAISPPVAAAGGGCTYTSDPTQPGISQGTMDLALTDEYSPSLLVGNQLQNRKNPSEIRVDTGAVSIEGVVTTVRDPSGSVIHEFTSLRSGIVDASTGNDTVFSAVQAVAIDGATAEIVREDVKKRGAAGRLVIAAMKVFGTTLGGTAVETQEFSFPIKLCYGCLIAFPPEADDAAQPGIDCLGTTAPGDGAASACALGQDQPIDCRYCRSVGKAACDRP